MDTEILVKALLKYFPEKHIVIQQEDKIYWYNHDPVYERCYSMYIEDSTIGKGHGWTAKHGTLEGLLHEIIQNLVKEEKNELPRP